VKYGANPSDDDGALVVLFDFLIGDSLEQIMRRQRVSAAGAEALLRRGLIYYGFSAQTKSIAERTPHRAGAKRK